jgi:hypothetical protein
MTRLASEIPVTKRMGQLPQSPPSFNCFPRGYSGRNPTCFDFGTMMFNIVQLISEPVGFLMIFGFPETSDQSLLLVGAAFLNDLNFTEKKKLREASPTLGWSNTPMGHRPEVRI